MTVIEFEHPRKFVTKDSGQRQEFPSGMHRDTQEGKADFTLLDFPMLERWALLMARGAEKYGRDNYKLANSQEELDRFRSSAFRHFIQWVRGDRDEDHAAAVYFNIGAAEDLRERIEGAPEKD